MRKDDGRLPDLYEDRLAKRAGATQSLESVASTFRQAGIQTTVHTPAGEAGSCIAELAVTQDVDIIAMATHGRSGISEAVLGSR